MNKIEVLATGNELMRVRVKPIEPVVEEIVSEASKEIQVLAYVLGKDSLHFLDLLANAAERKVRITIIVNRIANQNSYARTKLAILRDQQKARVIDFAAPGKRELHAKVVVGDRKKAVIGSANFSYGGMVSNYEVGVLIEGEGAWQVAQLVDELVTLSRS